MLNQWEPNPEPSPRYPQEEHTFYFRDRPVPNDELEAFQVVAPYAHDRDRMEGEVFRSEEELLYWVTGRPEEQLIVNTFNRVQAARRIPETEVDDEQRIARYRGTVERIAEDMLHMAKETGLEVDSSELFDRATRPGSPLDVPIFDPVSWFTGTNATGFIPFVNWLPMGGGFWRLAWFGWSNRPRSWRFSGWVWAFDGEYWNGASVLSGWFPFGYGPLSSWGMDSRVSSAIVL